MPNTYAQIYMHFIFAVSNRDCVIMDSWKDELYKYITGIVENRRQHLMAIGGHYDHVHMLVSLSPTMSCSDLMAEVKRSSSKWINDKRFVLGRFSWQEGFGAFSYSQSQIQNVIQYIQNQEDHHRVKTFREEYILFLKQFHVDYDEKYIFKEIDD